jgi:hypothetical protein
MIFAIFIRMRVMKRPDLLARDEEEKKQGPSEQTQKK